MVTCDDKKLMALALVVLRENENEGATRSDLARIVLEADLLHYEAWKRPLAGGKYDRALVGPVPQGLERVLEGAERGEILRRRRGEDGRERYHPGMHFPIKLAEAQEELTPEERDSLMAALGFVRSLSPEERGRRSRSFAAWRLGSGVLSLEALACPSEEALFSLEDRLWDEGKSREGR